MCGLLLTVMAIADEPAPLSFVLCEPREPRPSTSPLPWQDGSWAARYLVALISVGVLGGHLDQGNRYHEPPPTSGTAMNRMCLDDPSWTTPAEKQGGALWSNSRTCNKTKHSRGSLWATSSDSTHPPSFSCKPAQTFREAWPSAWPTLSHVIDDELEDGRRDVWGSPVVPPGHFTKYLPQGKHVPCNGHNGVWWPVGFTAHGRILARPGN